MPDDSSPSSSRRAVLTGVAAGIVTATAAGRARAADVAAPPAPLVDPENAYPRPPFPEQSQPWPGLAGKMTPRPDHGETSYRGSGRLAGRKALITGGDSGLGRAAAIAYAREGADVAIAYLPQEEPDAREVIALIRAEGRKAVALPGDLRDRKYCASVVERAHAELGGLDILVSNAGFQRHQASILDITDEQFDETFHTNIYALFYLSRAAIPLMPRGGAIIATASVNAFSPSEILLDYSATKGAIVAFVKSLAKQMVHRGIRVNAVAPGPFWTALQISGGQTEENIHNFGAETPMGRAGQPVELAPVYVLLASSAASYITGQVYAASGGTGVG
ncbi:SDR family oxidoreductase [Komagataeibacter sp. FNDCR2]|uniref:SDR family oxidoreductase n=1 Tax=Komagataeibacter sp. FNDCR2 TaxID=2878682 RepID=UPI001E56FD38|nr:SDR family oxidoreductase [Komagataeibacter sp. FNDCR2]MCE2575570.1 SDR family oxidoreductase [Komagataeibacter sp. FNDCR2]